MKTIRRSLGAFTFAAMIAASLVLMPAEAHAGGRKTGDFCGSLAEAITTVQQLPDGPLKDLLLGYLESTYKTYCGE